MGRGHQTQWLNTGTNLIIHEFGCEWVIILTSTEVQHITTVHTKGLISILLPFLQGHTARSNTERGQDHTPRSYTKPVQGYTARPNTEPVQGHITRSNTEPVQGHSGRQNTEPVQGHSARPNTEPVQGHSARSNPEPVQAHSVSSNTEPVQGHSVRSNPEPVHFNNPSAITRPSVACIHNIWNSRPAKKRGKQILNLIKVAFYWQWLSYSVHVSRSVVPI